MNGLSNEALKELQKKLQQEKQETQKRIEELNSQDPFADPDRVNDNAASDREASEEDGHDRVQALITELSEKEMAIDAALDRMSNGTYGTCINCGKQIEAARLSAFPTATMCISCQSKGSN